MMPGCELMSIGPSCRDYKFILLDFHLTLTKAIVLCINRNFLRQNWQVFKDKFQ